ncbi:cation:proton antiporter [Pelagibacterium halotolerans]|uniref:cation:proton antiporter n=1 Tax=Pelagibacterium halotolerans TaxID=531813 RepID=UPI00384CCB4D
MPHELMIGLGIILLVSIIADWIGQRTALPRVTLLVLIGVGVGPSGLNWLPQAVHEASELIATLALTMIAFLLGSELSGEKLRAHGRKVLTLSFAVVIVTFAIVGGGLALIGAPLVVAIVLGAVATATDPAATQDVVSEVGSKGEFGGLLLGIVAVDDAWGLIIFGFAIGAIAALNGAGDGGLATLAVHLGGAVAVGIGTGVPMALLSGRMKPGRPSLLEAIGFVLVCGGLAVWIGASFLLAATIAGALVANLARHHAYTFRQIEHFEWPFVTVFFVLAGAMLDIRMLAISGIFGAGYLVFRVLGRLMGGWAGGVISGLSLRESGWLGMSLLPQAGVAVGMALLAATEFPEYGETILAVTVGGTVVFEVLGPIVTRYALKTASGPGHAAARKRT